jgi:A/G-specific adenine glycosylase
MNFGETYSSTALIIRTWFEKNKRELPWRLTADPYPVWISEVILQQTRVDQGLAYYKRFMEAFPDVASLASAGEDEVLKIWQGLGYYSRARNLLRAAKDVMELRKGIFPCHYNDLLELRGVGPYTAAAIASICFGEARAVVDGNVSRVIARLYGVDEPINRPAGARQISRLARELMEEGRESAGSFHPGTHNQAMMEFGALQCIPLSPRCEECPLAGRCHSKLSGRVDQVPVKVQGQKPVDWWCYFFILTSGGKTILEKRDHTGIWRSLYQFPMTEHRAEQAREQVVKQLKGFLGDGTLTIQSFSKPIRHQLSHRTIHAQFIHAEISSFSRDLPPGWLVVPVSHIEDYPVPRLIHRYLESVKI